MDHTVRYQYTPVETPDHSPSRSPTFDNGGSGTYTASSGTTLRSRDRDYVSSTTKKGQFSSGKLSGTDYHSISSGDDESRLRRINSAIPPGFTSGPNVEEADDFLHNPHEKDIVHIWSSRGVLNVLTLVILILALLMLFAGYPIIYHVLQKPAGNQGGFSVGGTNGTGQIPLIASSLGLKDSDTPQSAQTWTNPVSKEAYHLVFSDEFNSPGRTFWPGDDPFWEAVDLWYGGTGDLEWYTPEQINTTDEGHLQITLTDQPMHNLNFRSGMLQSWNKFCFQGGYIEFSALLPGTQEEAGWWPGLWTMGVLGRPGYLGSTDGMWPYSYNECDSGILPNQTAPGRQGYDTVTSSRKYGKTGLSWLPGMRTPSCTCSGEDHPGPNNNVGRSAPEIDILEAQVHSGQGGASQSLQTAPFDPDYTWDESQGTVSDESITQFNSYTGGVYQEAVSAVTNIPVAGYVNSDAVFTTYGVEYTPDWNGDGNGHVTWYMNGVPTWTVTSAAVPARPEIDISQRLIPVEPMSIIMNLGISKGFQTVDFSSLTFPATMKVDYVRVYQPNSNAQDLVSCDPPNYPTSDYINRHLDVYNNANITTWPKANPKNKLTGC